MSSVPPLPLNELPPEQLRVFLKGYMGDWRDDTDESRGVASPPIQKPYPADAELVELVAPADFTTGKAPFAELVQRQRSRRSYTAEALSNEELSFLLWTTQGISAIARDEGGQVHHHLRAVPSAGARHPFETYLLVNRAEGVQPAVYRFLAVEHKLLLVRRSDDLPRYIAGACYGQEFPSEAAVVFIWCAVPRRMEWRYAYLAHRMIAIEAGHVGQNLCLAAESIGAGACAILGYNQAMLDALIDVDGKEEFTVYMASVGKIDAGNA